MWTPTVFLALGSLSHCAWGISPQCCEPTGVEEQQAGWAYGVQAEQRIQDAIGMLLQGQILTQSELSSLRLAKRYAAQNNETPERLAEIEVFIIGAEEAIREIGEIIEVFNALEPTSKVDPSYLVQLETTVGLARQTRLEGDLGWNGRPGAR